jgi:redox-sensitive bicupin YhaK (pirin superfamily)
MPAATVDDLLTLPTIARPDPSTTVDRGVLSITTAPTGLEGEGFPVHRAFAGVPAAFLDPFIHMDEMGAVDYAPGEPKGTAWHPHRGFETVTYMIDGTFQHQDSTGGGGLISDGDTQWMTAGGGILHIERPPEPLVVSGGLFHGVQLWVNLPAAQKMVAPQYQPIGRGDVALLASYDGGALVRLIAGNIGPHRGPGVTRTPITYAHATLAAGGELVLPWEPRHNALVYVLSGKGSVTAKKQPVHDGQLAVLAGGDVITLNADPNHNLDVLVLGGEPIREPVAWYGPFVMNTRAQLAQAVEDFQAGRMGVPPDDAIGL